MTSRALTRWITSRRARLLGRTRRQAHTRTPSPYRAASPRRFTAGGATPYLN